MKDGIETNMARGYGYLRSMEIYDKHFMFCFKMVLHHLSGTLAIPRLLLKILHFVKCVVPVIYASHEELTVLQRCGARAAPFVQARRT